MDFNTYQEEARKTAIYPNIGSNLWYPALGLGEAGEVQNIIKKIYRDKEGHCNSEDKIKLVKELGDILWYIAATASELNIPLDNIAWANLEKLSSRKDRGVIKGSGDSR